MKIDYYPEYISLEKEAEEFFSHNPKEKEVAFVMLDSDKLKAIKNDDSIYIDESDIFKTVKNENKNQ